MNRYHVLIRNTRTGEEETNYINTPEILFEGDEINIDGDIYIIEKIY